MTAISYTDINSGLALSQIMQGAGWTKPRKNQALFALKRDKLTAELVFLYASHNHKPGNYSGSVVFSIVDTKWKRTVNKWLKDIDDNPLYNELKPLRSAQLDNLQFQLSEGKILFLPHYASLNKKLVSISEDQSGIDSIQYLSSTGLLNDNRILDVAQAFKNYFEKSSIKSIKNDLFDQKIALTSGSLANMLGCHIQRFGKDSGLTFFETVFDMLLDNGMNSIQLVSGINLVAHEFLGLATEKLIPARDIPEG